MQATYDGVGQTTLAFDLDGDGLGDDMVILVSGDQSSLQGVVGVYNNPPIVRRLWPTW